MTNRKHLLISFKCLVFVIILALPGMCTAELAPQMISGSDCITQFKTGEINWSTGKILATGKATPKDKSQASIESIPGSARADANRGIIDILKQIKINSSITVGAYAAKNDIILAGMEKTAWDAVAIKQYYTSAFAVELSIETSMYGGFLQLVLPEEIRQIPKINPQINAKEQTRNDQTDFTGLIIDAKGLEVTPVLNPIIISEQGHDVYSSVFISREFAVQNGVSKYVCHLEEAFHDSRIGNHPLVIKGLRKSGKEDAVVISMADYQILEKTTERHRFLAECRVVIVID